LQIFKQLDCFPIHHPKNVQSSSIYTHTHKKKGCYATEQSLCREIEMKAAQQAIIYCWLQSHTITIIHIVILLH